MNVDTHDVRYICETETKAMEMFEELRNECIEECEESIQYYCGEGHSPSCVQHEQEKLAFLKTMKPKDTPPWCCDRPAIEVLPFLRSQRDIPSSKELIQLATHDFKNREERHHRHDQQSWTSGWITGFLSERKPNWGKEREERVRKEEREKIRAALCLHTDEDCVGEMNSDDCLMYEGGCTICKFDHAVKSKPKFRMEKGSWLPTTQEELKK